MTTTLAPPSTALTLSLPALRGALRALSGVLPSRTTLPVLSHMWLRAHPSKVALVASDLDTVVACWLPVVQPGLLEALFDPGSEDAPLWEALLPGRLLTDLSQRLGGDGAVCRLVPTAAHVVRLVTDVGTGEVVGADHEEFPVPSPYDAAVGEDAWATPLAVPAALLAELLEQALPAAAGEKDLERPQLATVRLQAEDATPEGEHPQPAVTVRLQAVDGSRIASSERTVLEQEIGGGERSTPWHDPRLSGPQGGVLLPLRAVRYLLPLLKRHGPGEEALVDLLPADREATPNLLQLRLPEVEGCPALLVRTRLQTGVFPDLERFFEAPAPIEGEVDLGALLYHCPGGRAVRAPGRRGEEPGLRPVDPGAGRRGAPRPGAAPRGQEHGRRAPGLVAGHRHRPGRGRAAERRSPWASPPASSWTSSAPPRGRP